MTRKKESAGGSETTTADTKYTSRIIPLCSRFTAAFLRIAAILATVLRGLA